jgi:hypothetical protein
MGSINGKSIDESSKRSKNNYYLYIYIISNYVYINILDFVYST